MNNSIKEKPKKNCHLKKNNEKAKFKRIQSEPANAIETTKIGKLFTILS